MPGASFTGVPVGFQLSALASASAGGASPKALRAAPLLLRPVVGTCEPGRYKAQSAGDVALLKCLDRANLSCTPAVDARGDALISAMRSQRKPQMLRLLEATRAGRRHCEAGKPSEPCTKGCWGGGSFGFHGKPLKNHFLVTHFYRALAGK